MPNNNRKQTRGAPPPRIRWDDRPLSERGVRQPTLLDAPDKATLAFMEYHHSHPEVFAAFRTIAMRLWKRGVTRYGARAIIEIVRYETIIRAEGEALKIDNTFVSYYARLLMMNDPRFAKFFEIRESHAKGHAA